MFFKPNKLSPLAGLIVFILLVSSCVLVRKATYPPDFTYLDKSTVTTSMQQLAISMDRIDRILNEADSRSVVQMRVAIINELSTMEKIADNLGAGTTTTNHLFIDQHIDQFKSDVVQARRFIETEPSNYYLAGKLVGSCISCHILRPDKLVLMNIE